MNGSGTLNRSRLTPNPPGAHDDPSYNAALKGASLAFQKSAPKPPPPTTPSRNVGNGALLAATSAAASRDHSRAVSRHTTGSSIQGGVSLIPEQGTTSQTSTQHLQPPSPRRGVPSRPGLSIKPAAPDPRSTSFIAATLAASRSASPVRQQIAQEPIRRQRKHSVSANNSAASSVKSLDLATDTTSIPPTNALISMFENKGDDDTDPVKKEATNLDNRKSHRVKPKPRPMSPPRVMSPAVKHKTSPSRPIAPTALESTASISTLASDVSQEKPRQPQNAGVEAKGRPPTAPPTRTKSQIHASTQPTALASKGKTRASTPPPISISKADTVIISPRPRRSAPQKILLNDIRTQDAVPEGQTSPPRKLKPRPPPPKRTTTRSSLPEETHRVSISSDDSFVSASSVPSPNADSPQRGRSRPSSPDTLRPRRPVSALTISTTTSTSRAPPLPRRHQQQTPSNLPLESLTDAIMAGSLASSRVTPSKTPPPKPPSRKQTPHMRQTLRQPPSKSDDEENYSKARARRKPLGKLGGGNKHSHHEGARKRWREEITARERKRYEGVWASNRGLLLVPNDPSSTLSLNPNSKTKELEQMVANVVVRDLWARSRLPFDELAEVWDLVDRRGLGYLDREEFVVGMWLIDQRLRGRKIPRKVTESVWGSARGVRVAALKHHGKK
ncbi:uncharacterized protein F4822DRAFT_384494 [Hypoxylon trugodes]|uniref:uncharacterized protein n=1 Tax=Hypoxylon trugodes TaxID=326681 RepID=UPI0021998F3B|nr:uncharacterized protein F4822DRAFT_384494 [Hypoxylon trugodes]KAI1393389.1 hypothetical protein F4822DRAFT_384494 [Hypoxylon trugodes]